MTQAKSRLPLFGMLAVISACAPTPAPMPDPGPPVAPPPVVVPVPPPAPPPPPPPPPSILPDGPVAATPESVTLERLAEQFLSYEMVAVRAAQTANMTSEATIAASVDGLAALVNPDLIDGARAFAVLQAARSPEFTAGVDAYGRYYGRDGFIAAVTANPAIVHQIPGYEAALRRASAGLASTSRRIDAAAEVIRQASYTLQRQSWSQRPINKNARLTAVTANWQRVYVPTGMSIPDTDPAQADKIVRDELIAAAALFVVRADTAALSLSGRGSGQFCARSAYLNTQQCLAASRFPYELTFCIAAHQLREATRCVTAATVDAQRTLPPVTP
jgi:hypothetical protein